MTIMAIGQYLSCVEIEAGMLEIKGLWVLLNIGQWTKIDMYSVERMRLGA